MIQDINYLRSRLTAIFGRHHVGRKTKNSLLSFQRGCSWSSFTSADAGSPIESLSVLVYYPSPFNGDTMRQVERYISVAVNMDWIATRKPEGTGGMVVACTIGHEGSENCGGRSHCYRLPLAPTSAESVATKQLEGCRLGPLDDRLRTTYRDLERKGCGSYLVGRGSIQASEVMSDEANLHFTWMHTMLGGIRQLEPWNDVTDVADANYRGHRRVREERVGQVWVTAVDVNGS